MEKIIKTLKDVNTKPGEWYSVFWKDNLEIRRVVLILDEPNFAKIETGYEVELNYFLDPIKISKEEAKKMVREEINHFKELLKIPILHSGNLKTIKLFLFSLEKFYEENFKD